MGHSRNDFEFLGSTLRTKHNAPKASGKPYEIRVNIINPYTQKPYTQEEILDALRKVALDFPNLAPKCLVETEKIIQKKGKLYSRYIKGKDKTETEKRLRNELLPDMAGLAKLLGRPQWMASARSGLLTIEELMTYIGDDAFVSIVNVNERSHVKTALRSTIYPAVGHCKISDFSEPEKYAKMVKDILARIRKDGKKSGSAHYAKLAMKCVMHCVEQVGIGVHGSEELLQAIQVEIPKRQNALLASQRPAHFSDEERERVFSYLFRNKEYLILFWLALICAGMDVEEICAIHYGDIEVIESGNGTNIYTCLITGRRRKATTDWRTVHVTTDSFPIYRFRRIVLPPWAAPILDAIMDQWRSKYDGKFIADLSLAADFTGKTKNPDQVRELLTQALKSAGCVLDVTIQRTGRDGAAFLQTQSRNAGAILMADAKYVASEKCLFNGAMLHASFGMAARSVDETNYLDVLSYDFAIARYLRYRRYNPLAGEEEKNQPDMISARGLAEYHVRNETETEATIEIDADFAVLVESSICPPQEVSCYEKDKQSI